MSHHTISKTDYVRYLECPRYAWLYKNREDLDDDEDSVVARQGQEVEKLAHGLFKEGVEVEKTHEEGAEITRKLIDKGEEVIYQAQPMSEKFLALADILVKKKDGWHLYEVKSSTQIKPEHIPDLRFQLNVFKEFGIELKTVNLIHINNEYVYSEKKGLELDKLFRIENVTDIVTEGLAGEVKMMKEAHEILTDKNEPKIDVLKRNFRYPMPEKMAEYYWKGVQDFSIYDISGVNPKKLIALEEIGVLKMTDVPDNFPLSANQAKQVKLTKEKGMDVNQKYLAKELEKIEFPIWFLDYETTQLAIPKFEGTHPWQQLAMQYSLHKMDKNGKLKHYYYLHTKKTFPFPKLVKHLKKDMGKTGTVISWNASFEKGRNKDMAEAVPKYSEFLLDVNARMYDLMKIFKNIYVDYRFKGGTSLKTVLPVLIPELSYKELEIQGGGDATAALYDIILGSIKNLRKAKKQLLAYCKLDTLAMVRIYEYLTLL